RIAYKPDQSVITQPELSNDYMSPLFLAVVEATEEAIYNSLFMAEDMTGQKGREIKALPLESTLEIMGRSGVNKINK
ncbi:MAG: P1 family peptidase, partial [Bacteroidetes bacterium]|nr:P1 family peptidase [Bacteroidota bacterium]